jgi:hypothetical protein
MIQCASARVKGINFQACSFNHSDISPFKWNQQFTGGRRPAQPSMSPSSGGSSLPLPPFPHSAGGRRAASRASSAWRRVDADVRVMLQHPARQVSADRFQHVIGHAHFRELGNDRVTQVVKADTGQARRVAQRAPGRVPLQHRLRRIVSPPLARGPEVMPWLRVPEQIGAFEHARHGFDRRSVQRDDAMARLVLGISYTRSRSRTGRRSRPRGTSRSFVNTSRGSRSAA